MILKFQRLTLNKVFISELHKHNTSHKGNCHSIWPPVQDYDSFWHQILKQFTSSFYLVTPVTIQEFLG